MLQLPKHSGRVSLVLLTLSQVAWFLFASNYPDARWVGTSLHVVTFAAAGFYSFLAARQTQDNARIGQVLGILGFGAACFSIASAVWLYYVYGLQTEVPFPSLADVFFIGTAVSFFVALARWARSIRMALTPVAELAAGVAAFVFLGAYTYSSITYLPSLETPLAKAIALVVPFFDTGMAVLAVLILFSVSGSLRQRQFPLLASAIFLLLADLVFYTRVANGSFTNTGDPADLLYGLTGCSLLLAGLINYQAVRSSKR